MIKRLLLLLLLFWLPAACSAPAAEQEQPAVESADGKVVEVYLSPS